MHEDTKPLRIGVVCYPTFGGSGVVATELGLAMAEKGHTVHFITYDRPVRLLSFSENVFYHEVRPQTYPLFEHTPYESALVSKIVDVARFEGLDLLHVHYALPHASVAYLARQILREYGCDLPFITTLHGTDITVVGRDDSYKPIVTFGINQSDAITTVSESLRAETLEYFPIRKPIEVVPNFIEVERYQPRTEDGLRQRIAAQGERVLIHVSNFRKVKRAPDVLEVFRLVREKIAARLMFVGDGPELHGIVKTVRELGLNKEVMFIGKQEAIEHILPLGDVFLLPSETESFGLAALEAMACGLPVIGSRAGGIPELVECGVSGFLSPVGDVEDMARNTLKILENPASLANFSAGALARARQFRVEAILPQYETLYRRVAAMRQPCTPTLPDA